MRINCSLFWWAGILSVRSETLNLTLQHCLLYWSHYFFCSKLPKKPKIIVQYSSGPRHDHRVTLWLPTNKVFEGMEQVWFLNFMLLLNHKQLSLCGCVCVSSLRWACHLVLNRQRLDKQHVPTPTNPSSDFLTPPFERSLYMYSMYRRDAARCHRGVFVRDL